MTTFAPLTPLDRRICLALVHLRKARYDSNPQDIHRSVEVMNSLLERIACRPLSVIDPELDKRLTVAG